MAKHSADIEQMLDELGMQEMSSRLDALVRSPEGMDLTPLQLVRDLVASQYLLHKNEQFARNLKLSKLGSQEALLENLKTGGKRIYNDNLVKQLSTLEFIDDRKNVTVVGESRAGKTYFLQAFCIESCRQNYRTQFVDYVELMDELLIRKRTDLRKFKTRLNYYCRIQVLIIDDFLIQKYTDEATGILYSLIKKRDLLKKTTMVSTQYNPSDWNSCLSDDPSTAAQGDGIRSRIIDNGYFVFIEKTN